MKNNIESIIMLVASIIVSFVCIYLFVFFGGYKLLDSRDIILQEIGASVIIGVVVFLVFKSFKLNSDKIDELEKRIEELENKK